jgi:uncharacterized protein YidB (DUF937 family)
MFENLLNLVKEHAGEAIVNNNAIPNEHNDAAINHTAGSITNTLASFMKDGNTEQISSLFSSGGDPSHPVASAISSNAVTDLMSKFGLDKGAAAGIVASMLPSVLKSFASKTNDPNDSSFDLSSITSFLGGQSGGGIMDIVKGFMK